jgi:cytochrome P450
MGAHLAPQQAVPAHVPPELVRPIALVEGPEFLTAPHAFMAAMHETHPPIFFSPNQGVPSWILTKHEDCYFVLRHPEIFDHGGAPFPRDPDNWFRLLPVELQGPEHRKHRAIVDPMVSPRAVLQLQDKIRKLANDLIDRFIDKGECEFTEEFGRPLPVSVFLDLMGLPQDMRDTFVGWAMGMLHAQDLEIAQRCMTETCAYLEQVIREKTEKPDEGLISTIVHGRVDGKPLNDRDIFGFVFFLFIGGLDTVFATLNHIWLWLAQNPARRHEIRENPSNMDAVVEELLRVFTVTFSGRRLTRDYELRGVKLKKGDMVVCLLPAANYDPEIFPNPNEVNFNRQRKPVLAFSGGAHMCMGAHLARLEIKIAVAEFLRRIPDFKVKDGYVAEYWPGGVIGPKTLPLTW